MDVANPHHLGTGEPAARRPFGIRVTAPPDDPFLSLVGPGWETFHWYPTAAERDRALADMRSLHRYSRRSDAPSIVLQAVER